MVVPAHRYRKNPEYDPNQPFTLAFLNGVKVICKGLKDPDSARGPNINWLWYDEAGRDKNGLAWQTAVASVRIGKDPQAWITTTPKGRNHWIYRFFIKQDIPQEAIDLFKEEGGDRELIETFNTTIRDNLSNLDPGFVAAMLAAYPVGWLRDQEIDGKFVDETGSLGDRSWFNGKILPAVPESVLKRVVYWDLAGSEKKAAGKKAADPDSFVRTRLSMFEKEPLPKFCIEHQYSIKRPDWGDFKKIFAEWAERDGATVPIYIEEEPGSGGINQVEELKLYIKENLGSAYRVFGHNPKKYGDKVMRANPWFAEAANGQFYMVQGNWNEQCLEQLAGFPDNVDHDDNIDSISGARIIIAPFRTWKTVPFMKV
jgi:predicted phage terminase large subunit-like protein